MNIPRLLNVMHNSLLCVLTLPTPQCRFPAFEEAKLNSTWAIQDIMLLLPAFQELGVGGLKESGGGDRFKYNIVDRL
jgi:hypothetical protein